jgi:hypothetical protein
MSKKLCVFIVLLAIAGLPAVLFGASDPNAAGAAAEPNKPVFQSWPPPGVTEMPKSKPVEDTGEAKPSSTLTAMSFWRLGERLYQAPNATSFDEKLALVLIDSAVSLDPFASYAVRDDMYLKTRLNVREDWQSMRALLINYLDRQPETEVARSMVRYLLEGMDTIEERERVLSDMQNLVTGKNSVLASDIATERGIMMCEKNAIKPAILVFIAACRLNPYNELAFAKLAEVGDNVTPSFVACKLRLAMAKNPVDLKGSFAFASFMESQGSYIIADRAYEYTADLYQYLNPGGHLPAEIYMPWTLCCYWQNDRTDQCLAIAEMVRAAGEFDPVVEGVALKAAENAKMDDKVKEISARVESKLAASDSTGVFAERAAWYYSFAAKDAAKSLLWANRAYASEPNVRTAKSLLVYALVMNGQGDVAWDMVKDSRDIESGTADQITMMAVAQKMLAEKQKDQAVAMLKAAIAKRPDTIEAAEARQLLSFNGESYAWPDEAVLTDIATELKTSYGENAVPQWMQPEKMLTLKLTSRMDETPSFDTDLRLDLALINNTSGPIVLGEGTLFGGSIRIDGELKGDIKRQLPGLITKPIARWTPIQPGESLSIPLNMNLNSIYDVLQAYPQANLEISFTAWLDPVRDAGKLRNGIAGMEPGSVSVMREGIRPSRELINNRLDALAKGYHSQKIQAAKMFASLLRERVAIDKGIVKYKAVKLEPSLLRSAMIRALNDSDWTVQVQAMAAMAGTEMDYDITNAVSAGLQSKNWPVRFMSIYLLGTAEGKDFEKVLKWYMEKDKDEKVRKLASVLLERFPDTSKDPNKP